MAGRFDRLTLGRFLQGQTTLCDSDAVHTARWEEENQGNVGWLFIRFQKGTTEYPYPVSKALAIDFAQADSKGKWISYHFPRLNW